VAALSEDSPAAGWDSREAQIVGCLVSKHVVQATYRDAVFRGMMSGAAAVEEIQAAFEKYDARLAKLLETGESDET
jgi:hypothetical protein